jgi:hypothetical protein
VSFHLHCLNVSVPHYPIRRFLALLAAAWLSMGSTFVDLEILRQDVKYDHDHEITVCLNSDDAKNFYRTLKAPMSFGQAVSRRGSVASRRYIESPTSR